MNRTRDEAQAKKLLAVSIAIIAVLFIVIVVLMMRHQKLRRTSAVSEALPTLAEEDAQALNHLRAFWADRGEVWVAGLLE